MAETKESLDQQTKEELHEKYGVSENQTKDEMIQEILNSPNRTSDEDTESGPEDAVGPVSTHNPEQVREEQMQQSADVAGGKGVEEVETEDDEPAKYKAPDNYNPYNDPIVPSSRVARNVKVELENLGESPTLAALHEAAQDDEDE